jgi:hypothetical protein
MKLMMARNETPFAIIEREIIQKKRKAFVIYGGAHLITSRKTPASGGTPPRKRRTIAAFLEDKYPGKTYSIIPWSVRYNSTDALKQFPGIAKTPFLLKLAGSDLEKLSAKKLFGYLPDDPVGEIMQAILFFGSAPDETVEPGPEVINDAAYQNEVKRRSDIVAKAMSSMPTPPVKK